jgi:uncharacterized protein Smg (DUF494 family)
MVNQQLVNYIQTQARNGYSYDQIGNYIMQQGYKAKDIKSAIKSLTKTPTDKKTIIQRVIIAIMIMIIGLLVWRVFFVK